MGGPPPRGTKSIATWIPTDAIDELEALRVGYGLATSSDALKLCVWTLLSKEHPNTHTMELARKIRNGENPGDK